ncbi:hypothetical protein COCCU_08350 [Corynebacterium occultum]|uniref:PepSY domain-containing protein n=1 Tax=Corynebacterium occultum TaxID=2675219 RepID=A0A6B8W255_9CORY|nr:PepSY domain-containing protein [Corynebacterium occultum]QGU07594.1 hypothetical protein COCCU_08350 [Corynebacterium occultum]
MITSRKILTVGVALSAGLFLSACADDNESGTGDGATTTVAPAESETAAPTTADEQTTTTTAADEQAGEDPVFNAIAAALAEHSGGIIISIDREDDTDIYDIDLVSGEELIELKVDTDGTVREDEREREDEEVVDAQNITVTVEDAIRQALDQNPEGILDDAELEEENGTLQWQISLDDGERNDLTELRIPA